MTPEDAYFDELEKDPSNQDVRRMFADHCEESGDIHRAACLRWMADNNKHPQDDSATTYRSWDWWYNKSHPNEFYHLPFELFKHLIPNHWVTDSHMDNPPSFKCWRSLREAEEALYTAWTKRTKNDLLAEEAQKVATP